MVVTEGEKGPPRGVKVPATNRAAVRELTADLRRHFGLVDPYLDVVRFIEHKLAAGVGLVFAVQPRSVLGDDEGRTYPDRRRLELRDDVYMALRAGDPRARFTAMHEAGHLLLHPGIPLRRTAAVATHAAFEDSEWQADCFAAEILMPVEHMMLMPYRTAAYAAKIFGVSLRAAMIRVATLKAEGVFRMS
jgi:hypothetical protein